MLSISNQYSALGQRFRRGKQYRSTCYSNCAESTAVTYGCVIFCTISHMFFNSSSDTNQVFCVVKIETVKIKKKHFSELFEFFTDKLAQPYEICHKTEDEGKPNDELEEEKFTQNRK